MPAREDLCRPVMHRRALGACNGAAQWLRGKAYAIVPHCYRECTTRSAPVQYETVIRISPSMYLSMVHYVYEEGSTATSWPIPSELVLSQTF